MKKGTKILLIVLCVVCLLVAAISAYRLISILGEYNKAVESYEDMSQSFVNAEPAATPEPTEAPVGEETAAEPADHCLDIVDGSAAKAHADGNGSDPGKSYADNAAGDAVFPLHPARCADVVLDDQSDLQYSSNALSE